MNRHIRHITLGDLEVCVLITYTAATVSHQKWTDLLVKYCV